MGESSCVRTIVVWKRTERKAQRTENFALRENHSGMETCEELEDVLKMRWLRENHSGMET